MPKSFPTVNRELSWLSFNERVLQESEDPNNPLLERLRFLGIFSSNRDEFFRVRVAGVKRMVDLGQNYTEYQDIDLSDLLARIQKITLDQEERFSRSYGKIIRELKKEGLVLLNERQLTNEHKDFVNKWFKEKVYPTLVPIMLKNVDEFPELKDRVSYFAVILSKKDGSRKSQYALIEIPSKELGRFLVLPKVDDKDYIIILDDVIRYCLRNIFAIFDYDQFEAYTIKITRDAELDLDNDVSEGFLNKMKQSLKKRKKGSPVRFVYDEHMPKRLFQYLKRKLALDDDDNLIPGGRYHNFRDYMGFPTVGRDDLLFKKEQPVTHPDLKPYENVFDTIREKDVLLHYPYMTFHHFIDFLREAAIDPKVKEIYVTMYRLADKSKVVNALLNAAKNGKEVTAVLELQARFDEENNIYWSNVLQEEGIKVLFGFEGLKIHSKVAIIGRKEKSRMVYYGCFGTGNFNESTAKIYCDLSLYTSNQKITKEALKIFGMLQGRFTTNRNSHIILSPNQTRIKFIRYINREIRNAKAGKDAWIKVKVNSLVDPKIIQKLYEASNAGVKIDIIVRGMCSLIPGKDGMSENIRVISILDKFLEHARIYIFCNDNKPEYFISSADMMVRNLDRRIELTCPIYDPEIRQEVDDIWDYQWKDNVKARIIDEEQKNKYVKDDKAAFRSQFEFHNYYRKKYRS